ncbi:MAG TPA: GNAT family N-acetyltransferase [Propylenella sp.]|nr:GNAT family N-acetyltransferase [Propylenella sp.]
MRAMSRLEPPSLRLSPLAPEHASALFPLLNDWDVVRMLAQAPWPVAPEAVAAHATRAREDGAESDDFAIVAEECIIGCGSIKRIGTGNPPRKMPRLGFWIGGEYRNKGYGRQAVARLVDRAFRETPVERIGAGVFHDNPASRRMLEKLGFEEAGRYETYSLARGTDVLTSDMQLSRSRWQGAET